MTAAPALAFGMSAPPDTPGSRPRSSISRWSYAILAYIAVGLALLGAILPGLPTFVFLLIAAWAAARGSDRLHDWLYSHPKFGTSLLAWERERAISTRAKLAAVSLMALSWLIMYLRTDIAWVPPAMAMLFLVVGSYVVTRPTPGHSDPGD